MLFLEKIAEHARLYPHKRALSQKLDDTWHHVTWQETWQMVNHIAAKMAEEGISFGDRVAILSDNSVEWSMVDMACMTLGAVSVPIYATSTVEQVRYIVNHAEVKMLFAQPSLVPLSITALESVDPETILVDMDTSAVSQQKPNTIANWLTSKVDTLTPAKLNSEDLLTIVYTSGTTGQPKGVMINHGNLLAAVTAHLDNLEFNPGDRSLAALPLSHIFERGWSYIVLYAGGHNHYLADVQLLQSQLADVKPHVFCAVPRIFEKIHTGIYQKAKKAGALNYLILKMAARVTRSNQQRMANDQPLQISHRVAQKLATALVGSKIKQALGGNVRFMPCGGAALDTDVHGFFMGLGINIKIGYGMTETLATVSFMPNEGYELGTLGQPMNGIDIKISPKDNEILIKSPSMTPGYYKDSGATDALFEDGWLRTGDAGDIDKQGNLVFKERIKELMKTSGGKYIAPQHVEGVITREPFFEQVAVIADARNFASALIVPAWEALEEHAQSLNIRYENRLELIRNSSILEAMSERLENIQRELARYEQVKKFTLLSKEFSVELGEITPTLKLRRKIINQRYKKQISDMYAG
jgi:long-chain acyl-CoA synthetase